MSPLDELHVIEEVLACLPSIRRLIKSAGADAPTECAAVDDALLGLIHHRVGRIAASLGSIR